jgi:hypothetical protein
LLAFVHQPSITVTIPIGSVKLAVSFRRSILPGMWTPEEQAAIEKAIEATVPDLRACPFCGKRAGYTLADGFVFLSTRRHPEAASGGGQSLPSVALICRKCGNTTLLNAVVLGLKSLLPPSRIEPGGAPQHEVS